MKILVTGGTGFVGSHSAAALAAAGHDVRLLVRSREKAKWVYEALGLEAPEAVVGDITDAASVGRALEGCEGVLHAAAVVGLDRSQALEVERTNRAGTQNVVGEAHRRGLGPIVYVSSVSALFDPEGGPITRDSKPTFQAGNAYSESKARTETYVRDLQEQGAPLAITYPTGVLGPDSPTLTEFHRGVLMQLDVALVSGSGGVAAVDVRDLAQVHAALFARPPAPARFLASSRDLDWREVADIIDEVTGRKLPRVYVPGSALRGLGWFVDRLRRFVRIETPLSQEGMVTATRWPGTDASITERELGVVFRDPRETFRDTLRWFGEQGHAPPRKLGRLAG